MLGKTMTLANKWTTFFKRQFYKNKKNTRSFQLERKGRADKMNVP